MGFFIFEINIQAECKQTFLEKIEPLEEFKNYLIDVAFPKNAKSLKDSLIQFNIINDS